MKLSRKEYLMYIVISAMITLVIIVLFRHYCNCKNRENFSNTSQKQDGVYIKKTTTYIKVYSHPDGVFSVWEPEPINSYYPMAHVIHKGTKPPLFPSYLVKASSSDEESKPDGFLPICKITDTMAVWAPYCKKGFSPIGMIFSNDTPSIHKFRCVRKENTDDIVLEHALFKNRDVQLWKIKDSPFFVGLNLLNLGEDKRPRGGIRRLLPQKIKTECNFELEMTKDYTPIGVVRNEMTKRVVSLWRPITKEGYVSLGDIVLDGYQNPNGTIETPVVKYKQTTPPLNFKKVASVPVEKYTYENSVDKEDTNGEKGEQSDEENTEKENNKNSNKLMTIWKPVPQKGYDSVGCIITKGEDEPKTTSIIGCIPLDMVKTIDRNCSKILSLLWNNEPVDSDKAISFWKDPTHRLHVNIHSTLDCVQLEPFSILEPNTLLRKIKKPTVSIKVEYENLDTNTSNYTFSEKIKAIQIKLASLGKIPFANLQFLGNDGNYKNKFIFGIIGNDADKVATHIILNSQTRELKEISTYVQHTVSKRKIGLLKNIRLN